MRYLVYATKQWISTAVVVVEACSREEARDKAIENNDLEKLEWGVPDILDSPEWADIEQVTEVEEG